MTTVFETVIAGEDAEYARQASQEIFRELDRLEGLLNRFNPSSDVARISRLKRGDRLHIAAETFECLLIASKLHAETNGAFDVTVGSLMDCTRTESGAPQKSSAAELRTARDRVGMDRLILLSEAASDSRKETEMTVPPFSVAVDKPSGGPGETGIVVDLGGIGKGYALDRSLEILDDWGIESALVHSGTSTALAIGSGGEAAGCPRGLRGWPVRVGGEWAEAAGHENVLLTDEAISGSGTEVKGGHILDPRTGKVAQHHAAAWVKAPSAALADALSTAFMVMSTDEVKMFCGIHPEVSALLVTLTNVGPEVRVIGEWEWLR